MKNEKKRKTLYAVISFATVIYFIASDITLAFLKIYYSRNYEFPTFKLVLSILTPIVVSIMIFIKILLQKDLSVQFSRHINIIVTIVFAIGAVVFYKPFHLLYFIFTYPVLIFVFCLQLCSLAYDLLSKRNSRASKKTE